MRLNNFISSIAKISRRQADRLLENNEVKINNEIINNDSNIPAWIANAKTINDIYKYVRSQKDFNKKCKIFVGGKLIKIKEEKFSAIVYHKPKGELVSTKDSLNRKLIYHSMHSKFRSFMPVGRLDFASEGLLILSDSKEVVTKLMTSNLVRTYLVKIDSKITNAMIESMQNGIFLQSNAGAHKLNKIDSMKIEKMEFEIIKNANISKLKLKLTQGQNREIRRFFAHFNANVLDLRRVSYGFVNLNALPVGKTRYFTKEEYTHLKDFLLSY